MFDYDDFCEILQRFTYSVNILTQTPNATRNVAEFYRNKFCRQTKLIAVSQKWPTNILKPLFSFYRLGITELCFDWSKRYFPIFRVFLAFDDHGFAFHNSVTFFHSGKRCCMGK